MKYGSGNVVSVSTCPTLRIGEIAGIVIMSDARVALILLAGDPAF